MKIRRGSLRINSQGLTYKNRELGLLVSIYLATFLMVILLLDTSFLSWILNCHLWSLIIYYYRTSFKFRTNHKRRNKRYSFNTRIYYKPQLLLFSGKRKGWKTTMTGGSVLSYIWFETRVNSMKYIHTVNFCKCEISVLCNRNSLPMETFETRENDWGKLLENITSLKNKRYAR